MSPPAVKPPTTASGLLIIVLVAVVGGAVGLLVPLPLALSLRDWLGLPGVNATPTSRPLTATYWLPWLLSWLAANSVGLALVLWPRTRRLGRWFLLGSLLISTPVVWFYFGLEYTGFSPD